MSTPLALVLGIRPDVIRASRLIKLLDDDSRCNLQFIWSGQHYSDNLKDVFFRDLGVRPPDVELGCGGATDAETTSLLIARLYKLFDKQRPQAAVFLGDTNTVVGCLAAAQLNVPIVHIEGCMRSFDWRMPEEKYRTLIDHLSDVIYAYLPAYRDNGIAEGISPARIVVTGNPIVDVIQAYYPGLRADYSPAVLRHYGVRPREFVLMTAHRRENIQDAGPLQEIMALAGSIAEVVIFPAGYGTQRSLGAYEVSIPSNVRLVDPIGYKDFLSLLGESRYVITDSGTVVEEACVLRVPSIQMRRSTERPEVYEVGASVRFDPGERHSDANRKEIIARVLQLTGSSWQQPFGDGAASERIAADLLDRCERRQFMTHELNPAVPRVARAMFGEKMHAR